jgi:peptidoglycan/LPS O-acetylase OafA/YrhL
MIPLIISTTRMRAWPRKARAAFFLGLFLFHSVGNSLDLIPHMRLSMFIAGILLYEIVEAGWIQSRASPSGEVVAMLVYAGALIALALVKLSDGRIQLDPDAANLAYSYWTALLFVAIPWMAMYCFTFNGILNTVFCWTPLRLLGNMSYSYFLCHGLVLRGVAFVIEREAPQGAQCATLFIALFVSNLLFTLAGSFLLFVLVEKPFSLAPKAALRAAHAVAGAEGRSDRG